MSVTDIITGTFTIGTIITGTFIIGTIITITSITGNGVPALGPQPESGFLQQHRTLNL
jgi:hypothetical protein